MQTTCAQAIKLWVSQILLSNPSITVTNSFSEWWSLIQISSWCCILQEAANNLPAEEADYIKLYCQMPPISKMDASLNTLKNCEYVECNLLYFESKFFKWIQCFFAVQHLPRSHFLSNHIPTSYSFSYYDHLILSHNYYFVVY